MICISNLSRSQILFQIFTGGFKGHTIAVDSLRTIRFPECDSRRMPPVCIYIFSALSFLNLLFIARGTLLRTTERTVAHYGSLWLLVNTILFALPAISIPSLLSLFSLDSFLLGAYLQDVILATVYITFGISFLSLFYGMLVPES
jgi:hypothetical protein